MQNIILDTGNLQSAQKRRILLQVRSLHFNALKHI